jgi:hypothetical protein
VAGNVSCEYPAVGRDTARRARFGLLADFDTVCDTAAFGVFAILALFLGARLTLSAGRFARFGALGVRRARVAFAVDLALLSAAALVFLAFFAVFLGLGLTGLTVCTGRFACFNTLRVAPLFARRLILRARFGAVFVGLGYFLSCSSTLRSFFSSFLRRFSSFALFLSLLLSRFFDAMASSPSRHKDTRRAELMEHYHGERTTQGDSVLRATGLRARPGCGRV